jgi:hypothetical protein
MARALKLRRSELKQIDYVYVGAFRLRVDVIEVAGGMDPNIFLYRADPFNPHTGETLSSFITLASVCDVADYPPFAPDPTKPYPFFRLPYFEIDVRAQSLAESVWVAVLAESGALCAALDRLDQLEPSLEVWVGELDAAGAPEAASESVSASMVVPPEVPI